MKLPSEAPPTAADDLSEVASTGWTREVYGAIVAELFQGHGVQAKAIMTAVNNGGFVSRDEVYELGGYAQNRSLKGFTRPSNRITQRYQGAFDQPEPLFRRRGASAGVATPDAKVGA